MKIIYSSLKYTASICFLLGFEYNFNVWWKKLCNLSLLFMITFMIKHNVDFYKNEPRCMPLVFIWIVFYCWWNHYFYSYLSRHGFEHLTFLLKRWRSNHDTTRVIFGFYTGIFIKQNFFNILTQVWMPMYYQCSLYEIRWKCLIT